MRDEEVSHAEVSARAWLADKLFPADIDIVLAKSNGSPKCSNLSAFLPGRVKRWDVAELKIPIFLANEHRAIKAAELVESVLGNGIFSNLRSLSAFVQEPAAIRFSKGRAVGDPKRPEVPCSGNVGVAPGHAEWGPETVSSTGHFQRSLCINLDSQKGDIASLDVAVHELGHALGLGDHFDGFGEPDGGPAVDVNFWAALVRLYQLPIGAEYASLPPLQQSACAVGS